MKTRASCSPVLRKQPTKSKRNTDLEEISRVLEPEKLSVDSNRFVLINDEGDDKDEDEAATTTSGEELGFRSTKGLVWAKAYPYAWWPGWIQKAYRGKSLVSFFGSERSLWCRESEIRPFETDFKVKVGGLRLPPDAIDLALDEYRRRLISEVACPCQREISVGGLEVDVENTLRPADAFKFVRKIAVSPSFEEVDSVGVFRVAAQINAFRSYAFVERDSVYEKTMRISEAVGDSEENMESTCLEDDKSRRMAPEVELSEEEEGEEKRKGKSQEQQEEEPKEEEPEEVEQEVVELEVEPDEEPQEEEPEEEDEEEYVLSKFLEQQKSGAVICKKNDKELLEQQHLIERSEPTGKPEELERVEPEEDDEDEYILRRFVEHWSSGSVIRKKNSKEHLEQHMTERSQTTVNEEELEEVEPEEEEEDEFVLRKLVEQRNSGSVISKKNSKDHRGQQHLGRSQTTINEEEEPEEEEEYTLRKFVEQRKSSSVICKRNSNELPIKHLRDRSQATINEVFQPVEVLAFVKRMAVSSWVDDVDTANVIRKAAQANTFRRHTFIEHDWIYRDTMRLFESNDDSKANMKSAFPEDDQTCEVVEDVSEDDQTCEVVEDVKVLDKTNHTSFVEQVKKGSETRKEITEDSSHDILKHLYCLALNPFYSGCDVTSQKILSYRALVYQNIPNLHSPSKDTEVRKRRRLSSSSNQSVPVEEKKVGVSNDGLTQKSQLGSDVANDGLTQKSHHWPDEHFQHNKRARVDATKEHVAVSYSRSNVEDVERVASEIVDLFRDMTESKGKSKSNTRHETKDAKASGSNGEGKDIIDLQRDCNGESESNKRQKTEDIMICRTSPLENGSVADMSRDTPDSNGALNKKDKTGNTKSLTCTRDCNGDSTSDSELLAGNWASPINGIRAPKPSLNVKPTNTHRMDGKSVNPKVDSGPNKEEPSGSVVSSEGVGRFCRRNVDKPVAKFQQDKPWARPLTMLYSSPLSATGAPPLSNGNAQAHTESESPTTLHMMFPKSFTPPTKEELVKQFRRFGPIDYSKTKIFFYTGSAQIMFKYHLDAEAALHYAKRKKVFTGGANVRYWLNKHEHSRNTATTTTSRCSVSAPSLSVPNLKSCLKISNPQGERSHLHVKFPPQVGPPDISPQMLVLLEKCNRVVTTVKSNLGIRDFYSLFTHNYCQVKLDDG